MVPPGTKVIIQTPICPICFEPADYQADYLSPDEANRDWPDCYCGFSWKKWAEYNWA